MDSHQDNQTRPRTGPARWRPTVFRGLAVVLGLVAILTVVALLGSLLVSYTRARAEALGAQCKVGIATRAERVLLLAVGLCANWLGASIQSGLNLYQMTIILSLQDEAYIRVCN